MNITEIFIRRPVMTTLVMLAILIFGVVGYRTLPVSDLPNVDFPTIMVNAGLPGASPEMMAASVATPLERQFSTIPGVDSMSSSSSLGSTSITIQFSLDRDIDGAAQDVQTAIATAQRMLPSGMPSPPTFRKVNPADMPILMISLNSPTLPLSEVDNYAENILAQRISMVTEVAQVNVFGSAKYAVRAQLDPTILASRGISINEVGAAISAHNVNMPSGTLWGPRQAYTVQATGQLTSAEAYRPLVVAYRNGAPVRLQELGRVIDSVQNDKSAAWYNDKRSVTLPVQRQPGTNTVEVVDSIKALLPTFSSFLPPSVNMDILIDRSQSIRESVNDVKFTLLLTVIRSPLNGRTGSLDAKQGSVVSPNTTLMTINQIEPMDVTFSVPEARLKAIHKSQAVTVTTQDDPASPQSGHVTFIDNTVDPTTGTIRIKGTFPNTNHSLWPGQFVRVTLRLATLPSALVIPKQAVQTGQEGQYVFVVKADHTVESRPVVAGQQAREEVVIQSGLAEGEIVVVEGQLRLAPGSCVQLIETPGEIRREGTEAQKSGADKTLR